MKQMYKSYGSYYFHFPSTACNQFKRLKDIHPRSRLCMKLPALPNPKFVSEITFHLNTQLQ